MDDNRAAMVAAAQAGRLVGVRLQIRAPCHDHRPPTRSAANSTSSPPTSPSSAPCRHWPAGRDWAVYEVRRLYFAADGDPRRKGTSWRSCRPLFIGTQAQARAELDRAARQRRRPVTVGDDGHHRVWLRDREPNRYPAAEHFPTVTLAGVEPKSRPRFAERWAQVCGTDPTLFTCGAAAPASRRGQA
jgi:hypothetical protein